MRRDCPLCGSSETRRWIRGIPATKESPFSITQPTYGPGMALYLCKGCEVIFASPLPSEEGLAQAYAGMEDPYYIEEKGGSTIAKGVVLLLEKKLGRKGRLLDVGCFCGTLLSEARQMGWEIEGVEPSRWAIEKARELFGIEVRHPSLTAASFPENSFDAVTAVDVLEHFLYPKEEVSELHRILKVGGLLYLSTPDVGSLASRILRRRWWGYRPEHLFYFSRRSLRSFLISFNFEPVWEAFTGVPLPFPNFSDGFGA